MTNINKGSEQRAYGLIEEREYVEEHVFDQIYSEGMPVVDGKNQFICFQNHIHLLSLIIGNWLINVNKESEQRAYGLIEERVYVEAHVFDQIYSDVMPVVDGKIFL